MPQSATPQSSQRIAYLTSQYPAPSHTFIQREVTALRAMNRQVDTYSVRGRPDDPHSGTEEREAARTTTFLLQEARNPASLIRAKLAAWAHPGRAFRALRLAFATSAPGPRALLYQMFYYGEACILARKLRRTGATHLHVHFASGAANVALIASELTGLPMSFTLHGPADLYEPYRWHLGTKVERAAFVACISHFARSQAMFFSDASHWDRLRIIHCGVEPARYQRPRVAHEGVHLVFVGRLAAVKGLRVLIEAFGRAKPQVPGLRLTIVGDGDDRPHLEALAAPFGDAIRFAGYLNQEEVAEVLATADIFTLPSFAEGVPVVLMEALASAMPVISTHVAGIPELVEDGVSGYLVPPGCTESLRARIVDLAGNADLRQRMGEAGRAKVAAEFDIAQETARLASLFDGNLGDNPRPEPAAPGEPRTPA
ncbi:MAG: colanic acid biosynthesis glycosyltransferase WcaL [Planctomycetota bacterium]|nr:MAG: colanic acid biosynthesis glycosyltransferase WcaL [Planctomycetota bacterium]